MEEPDKIPLMFWAFFSLGSFIVGVLVGQESPKIDKAERKLDESKRKDV